jgi:hypothetical protein
MMNHYAIADMATRAVERLSQETPDEVPDGHEAVELAVPVRAWPAGTGELHCSAAGVLYFVDSRTLPELKVAKNAELNAARLLANRSGFEFASKLIASDELSRSDIDAVQAIVARTGAMPAGWPGGWKAVDNSYLPITDLATWDAFYAAMYQTGLANFARAQNLKAQVEAATTPEEVAAIRWDSPLTGGA